MTLILHLTIKYSHNLTRKIFPGIIRVAAGKIPNDEYTWHFGSLKRKKESQPTAANDKLILLDLECVGAIVNGTV